MRTVVAGVAALALAAGCGDAGGPPDATTPPEGQATESTVLDPADVPPAPETPESVALLAGAAAEQLTIARFTGVDAIDVMSETFAAGDAIPLENSAYGDNVSPQVSWSAGPEGTMSYTLVMEDPDLPGNPPFLHWIVGDIPADVTSLEAGFAAAPEGAFQTGVRDNSYFGPRPPSGVHNYTFQVFALDKMLELEDGATLDLVKAAMEGHVLAAGALQATYAAPPAE